ncbi:unnamed protein product [Didymodactylos carnosus]|uniref:Uncharacterized protein n=1 Tax=Didymodactylos carnosus TaxID=1234261 RepID=A0A815M0X3_9BILA|nr:unnamed protein product [Didymodactylos carnosus]CAF1420506.1 unnamed protein product [Didymodactylos carnosus]CAF4221390.1 unnamed protein product [Didymodactylos carnosus]CAF4299888.1 unnamed protein product [Didymodactylos carnosus]
MAVQSCSSSSSWGYLEPLLPIYPKILLSKPSYIFGRNPAECDVSLNSVELKQHEYFVHLSSKHFILESIENGSNRRITFHDISRNGCFVDGQHVHKRKILLRNNEHVVSLALNENKVYRFIRLDGLFNVINLDERYMKCGLLGRGSFAAVSLALSHMTHTRRAIKIINKEQCEKQIGPGFSKYLYREVSIHGSVDHPCILRRYEVYHERFDLFVEMEYASGGSLYDRINNSYIMDDEEVKFIFYQIAFALSYLHRLKIVHRDIKPANILLMSNDKETVAKLSDFGVAKYVYASSKYLNTTIAGTQTYMAPEVQFQTGHSTNADVWSFGMTLLNAYVGESIFRLRTIRSISSISNNKKDLKDILNKTLERNTYARPDMSQLLKYSWFRDLICVQRIQQLIQMQTGKHLNDPFER